MNERISFFKDLIMKIQCEFLKNELFQAIGLDLSCVNVVIETKDDYTFNGIEKSKISSENYPLSFYSRDDKSIHIFIDHELIQHNAFIKSLKWTQDELKSFLMLLLFHEANHHLLLHINRMKERDRLLWNIACDIEIHNMLFLYKNLLNQSMFEKNFGKFINDFVFSEKRIALFEPMFSENVAEEIYSILDKSKKIEENTFSTTVNNKKINVTEVTYELPSGKIIKSSFVDFPESDEQNSKSFDEKTNDLTKNILMKNILQNRIRENTRGNDSNTCSTFLNKLFYVKIDWKKILKASLATICEKSGYGSWANPRTSLFALKNSPYLPGLVYDDEKYNTVFIVRDESGSITDEECQKAASIIFESKEFFQKVIAIKHDTKITAIREIKNADDDDLAFILTRESSGGTSHRDVFEYIKNYIEVNGDDEMGCCIFITDMESDIEYAQTLIPSKIPCIYLTTNKYYNSKNINGKVILIE